MNSDTFMCSKKSNQYMISKNDILLPFSCGNDKKRRDLNRQLQTWPFKDEPYTATKLSFGDNA
jgi:hypothetical protein